MRRRLGHFRNDSHRRGPGAYDDDTLVRVIETFRPVLRMDEGALKRILPVECRQVAMLEVVITGAHEQQSAAQLAAGAGAHRLDDPGRRLARVVRPDDPATVLNPAFDTMFSGRLADVSEDGGAICNCLRLPPGPETVAQGVHIAIGADPGVAEQIPGTTEAFAALENRIGDSWAPGLEMTGRPDAR